MRRWHYNMLKKTVATVLSVAMVTGTINLQTANTQAADRSKEYMYDCICKVHDIFPKYSS